MSATLTRRRGRTQRKPTDSDDIKATQRADIERECERGWSIQRIADAVDLPDGLVRMHLKAMGWPVVGKPRAKGATTTAPKPGTNANKNGRGSCVAKILAYIQEHTSATVSELRGRTGINEDHIRATLKLHPELFREVDRISVNNAKTSVWGLVGGKK